MYDFIEDYPGNKARTLALAKAEADERTWCDEVDDEFVYRQLASPEFDLYMEMIMSDLHDDTSNVYAYIQ